MTTDRTTSLVEAAGEAYWRIMANFSLVTHPLFLAALVMAVHCKLEKSKFHLIQFCRGKNVAYNLKRILNVTFVPAAKTVYSWKFFTTIYEYRPGYRQSFIEEYLGLELRESQTWEQRPQALPALMEKSPWVIELLRFECKTVGNCQGFLSPRGWKIDMRRM